MVKREDEQAIGKVVLMAIKSRIVTSLITLSVGGAGGTYFSNRDTNSKLDALTKAIHGEVSDKERISFLEESNINIIGRVEKLEGDTVRIPYRRRRG